MTQTNSELNQSETINEQNALSSKRKKGFMALGGVIIVVGLATLSYWYFIGSRYISTDNAYTGVEQAQITPAIGGIVQSVAVVDTQHVHKGDVLVKIDDTDAKLAFARAKAQLALAKRHVRSYIATNEQLSALVNARSADEKRAKANVAAAEADLQRAQIDYKRRVALEQSGSVSAEELTNAQNALAQATARLQSAKAAMAQSKANRLSTIGSKKANEVLIAHTTVETNPEVLQAQAQLKQAQVNLSRTVIRAPVDGIVAQRQVDVGRRVEIGEPLMEIVPVAQMHVDANFKEGKLTHVKIGQPVKLTADIYGDDVVFHGVVTGLSGGTGSAFSTIPAQNATGNWIKVVQRLPVRIELDPNQLKKYPLSVGLSMEVTIDTQAPKTTLLAMTTQRNKEL
ncbi:HlyD family efflux transporter periplasmic adaptor subunit [Celerinatantimonas sp. MCCC 1A17872]|uniref:HlyD family secretion protein n=1 Tax=Celerinatantimonas sp. MCCC 1A17872 TaxID=3177514 RepID=UPI0038CB7D01